MNTRPKGHPHCPTLHFCNHHNSNAPDTVLKCGHRSPNPWIKILSQSVSQSISNDVKPFAHRTGRPEWPEWPESLWFYRRLFHCCPSCLDELRHVMAILSKVSLDVTGCHWMSLDVTAQNQDIRVCTSISSLTGMMAWEILWWAIACKKSLKTHEVSWCKVTLAAQKWRFEMSRILYARLATHTDMGCARSFVHATAFLSWAPWQAGACQKTPLVFQPHTQNGMPL